MPFHCYCLTFCVLFDYASIGGLRHGLLGCCCGRFFFVADITSSLSVVDETQLRNLSELNLRGNRITSVPEGFGTLRKLERLNLGDNLINDDDDDASPLARLGSLQV